MSGTSRSEFRFSIAGLKVDETGAVLAFVTLVAVCCLVFLVGLGDTGLWDVDEGMHAAMGKNMLLSGDWVTPVFNGEPFFDKPVMFNWLVAISFWLFGFTDFAARLPAALMGIGCVLLTYGIGRRLFGLAAGFFAALALATSLEFLILSRMVIYDVPFTFFTTLSLYFLCDALFGSRRSTAFIGFHVSVALAILTKGPLGFVIPWLAVCSYLLWQRDLGRLREFRLANGALIITAIVAPWYVMMESANPGFIKYFIVKQHIANMFGHVGEIGARHPQPVYYYVPVLLLGFFPWSSFLPGAVYSAWKRRSSRDDEPLAFLLILLVSAFVFFSIASSKLVTYILPLFPPAALLLGRYVTDRREVEQNRWTQLLTGLAVSTLVALMLTIWAVSHDAPIQLHEQSGLVWHDVETISVVLTSTMVAALLFAWRGATTSAAAVTATAAPMLMLLAYVLVAPDIYPFRSSAQIGAAYDALLPPREKLVFSEKVFDAAVYYTGRDAQVLDGRAELDGYLRHDERVYLLARRDSGVLVDCRPVLAYVVYEFGNKVIVSNKSDNPKGNERPRLPELECLASGK